jgi:hypothetical protein
MGMNKVWGLREKWGIVGKGSPIPVRPNKKHEKSQ